MTSPSAAKWFSLSWGLIITHDLSDQGRAIPKGLNHSAQGCEPASYPGKSCKRRLNPNGVVLVLIVVGYAPWPLGVNTCSAGVTAWYGYLFIQSMLWLGVTKNRAFQAGQLTAPFGAGGRNNPCLGFRHVERAKFS